MTISEMHTAVKLGLDKTASLQLPAFEPEEIDFWLNDTILEFVKTRMSGNNPHVKGFEQNQKRVDDLRTLVSEVVMTPEAGLRDNTFVVEFSEDNNEFPDDFLFFLNDETVVEFIHPITNGRVVKNAGVTECTSDTYYYKLNDPYGEHILHMYECKPLRLFNNYGVELFTDGNYDITDYRMRYIRKPAVVSSVSTPPADCDLPEHTHAEIVKMTVNKLLENIEAPRYQTHSVELTKVE